MTNPASFLLRRAGRTEYWVFVGLIVAAAMALRNVGGVNDAITILWVLTWARRLRDTGKSGWYALAPVGAIIAIITGFFALGGDAFGKGLTQLMSGVEPAVMDQGIISAALCVLAVLAVQLGFTIWLGAMRGSAGDNKFGKPTNFSFSSGETKP